MDERVSRWVVHGERVVDDTRLARLHVASVELPDGARFEQYVLRCPAAAMCVAVDSDGRVLMIRRHRFIIDAVVWELPGGYVDAGEDPAVAAGRESVEETGWSAGRVEFLVRYQPMVGMADWTVPGLVDTRTGCLILQERYDGFDT
jgi:ADP-ribose pyrophosphatase